jgi:NADPH:quinone reductase-like Zn-dependent oxidoreductase
MFLKPNGEHLNTVANWLHDGTIKTIVEKIYPFDQVKEAFAHLETGRVVGKIVVQIADMSEQNNGKQEN